MTDLFDLETYNYDLPQELIAQFPFTPRDKSRLLRVQRNTGRISHHIFDQIEGFLNPGEVLVLNNSRVIPARLWGHKASGAKIELLLLHETEPGLWQCMVSPGRKLKQPQWIEISPQMRAFVSQSDAEGLREVSFETDGDFWEVLENNGHTPLPPYIKRQDQDSDRKRYQTVFAENPGSAAAPTAGLHFTPELLSRLQDKSIKILKITLHVGMGTFLPVKSPRIDQHKMHSEFCSVDRQTAETINQAKAQGRRIIAVGSTSARVLHSFWDGSAVGSGTRWTNVYIYPGKKLNVTDAMITNFHLPKSSLLLMISAFAGYDLVKEAYRIAIEERYRFFSYGDAMFIE